MRPLALLAVCLLAAPAAAQGPLPPARPNAALVLDPGAAAAPVTALAFSPDGTDLYVGGLDKAVRRYRLANGKYVLNATFPVPIGPGNAGAVNAVAVSPDGKWVAVAGRAPFREEQQFGEDGVLVPTAGLPAEAKVDHGVVYLFDPANPAGGRVVRGQAGEVRALAFARPGPAGGPALVTAGLEWQPDGRQVGAVHVFDAATGKELAARTGLPATDVPPGLAAWPHGGGVRVAIAWERAEVKNGQALPAPGKFLLWDAAGGDPKELDDGALNSTLTVRYAPGGGGGVRVVTTGSYSGGGRLVARTVDGTPTGTLPLRAGDGVKVRPLALAALGDTTAVAVETVAGGKFETELWFVAPDGTPAKRPLPGAIDRTPPVFAATADGRALAVGGFTDHRVEVYDAAGKLVQTIPGAAGGFAGVAFVAGNRLWAGGPNETPAKGGVVFDFDARQAADSPGGLAAEAPKGGGPVPLKFDEKTGRVTLPAGALTLGDTEEPTADPVVVGPKVVAVAHTDYRTQQSFVTLFDPTTGRKLRRLVGPVQPIRALAAAPNGVLLAAAAGDRTVTVWSLKDLGREPGAVEGLVVGGRDKKVVVASVDAAGPAKGKLAADDVIEAVGGEQGELKPVTTGNEFRDEVGARAVGTNVRVRRSRAGGKAEDVVLPVGRAVVQQGPLFSLWVDPAANAAGRNWVGWHPAGFYDANSRASEDRVSWLTATSDPAQPAVIAGVGQYRGRFYKRTILQHLAAEGALGPALDKLPPPEKPKLLLSVSGAEDHGNLKVVRPGATKLEVVVYDPDDVAWLDRAVLRWRAAAGGGQPGEWQDVPVAGGSVPAIDLAGYGWARGPHRFHVTLTTATGLVLEDALPVVYLPPRPVVSLRVDGKDVENNGTLPTPNKEVKVVPSVAVARGTAADVELSTTTPLPDMGNRLALKPNAAGAFDQLTLPLDPLGRKKTVVRLVAVNQGAKAFPEYEYLETGEYTVNVSPDALGVGLRVTSAADPLPGPGRRYVTDEPEVTVEAAVASKNAVDTFGWTLGEKDEAGRLAGRPLVATRTVKLPATGEPLTIRARAVSETKLAGEDSVEVVYAPLPRLGLAGLPPTVTGPDLPLGGTATAVPPALKTRVTVVVTSDVLGQSREVPAVLDPATGTWKAAEDVQLFPGKNRVGLSVRNAYRERRDAGTAEVTYLRPPAVVEVRPVNAGTSAVGALTVFVAAASDVGPTGLTVNGSPVDARPKRVRSLFGLTIWEVKAEAVPVRVGDAFLAQLHVVPRNADGDGPPAVVPVVRGQYVPAVPPGLGVVRGADRIANGQSVLTNQPRFDFAVRVTSGTPLARVELRHQAGPHAPLERVREQEVSPRAALPVPGGFDLRAETAVELRPGVNRIKLAAANAGAEDAVEFTVTFAPPPVRVVIEGIDEAGPNGGAAVPLGPPGPTRPVVAGTPYVTVRGKVVWTQDDERVATARDLAVVLSANQVVHFPATLQPAAPGTKERAFTAPLFLNAARTRVAVEVRGGAGAAVAQQGVEPAVFNIDCQDWLKVQRLHVVVIAPDVNDGAETQKLLRQVVTAVGGEAPAGPVGPGVFKHRGFTQAVLYRPLLYYTGPSDVTGKMREVYGEIDRAMKRPGNGWVNDVVLVYYQGRDRTVEGVRRLATSGTGPAGRTNDPTEVRVNALERTPGVRLIVLNVSGPGAQQAAADPLTADPLQLRYPWKDPAAGEDLLPLFGSAVAQEQRLGGVVERVGAGVRERPARAGDPTDALPDEVKDRPLRP